MNLINQIKPNKKYHIITKDNKEVYFGAAGHSYFTIHKDDENWTKSRINSAGFWSSGCYGIY